MTPQQLAASNTEHAHQRAFFAWLNMARMRGFDFANHWANTGRLDYPTTHELPALALAHAIPNGGARDKITAGKLKAEGVKPGVPDVFIPVAARAWSGAVDDDPFMCHGLYIELKRPDRRNHARGGRTDEQVSFMAQVERGGYAVAVAYSWKDAANAVVDYFKYSAAPIVTLDDEA